VPPPPKVATVVLAIRSRPPGALIAIDGVRIGAAPLEIIRPLGPQPLVIEASLDGRVVRQKVIADRDRTIDLVLRRPTPATGMPF
jgi:hypothetical protein